MEDKITVVVPVYNRADLVERSLESIRVQDVRPMRLIIVDNGSTDGTGDVCRRWASAHSGENGLSVEVAAEPRRGAARARQTGFEMTESEWVYFFDSDDEMRPGILSVALAESADMDMVYWPVASIDEKEQWRRRPFSRSNQMRRHIYNGMLCTISYIVRSDYLRGAGGWRPEAMVWDDWELGVRLLMGSPRITSIDRIGAYIHSQTESITGTEFHSRAGEWERTLDMVESTISSALGERPFSQWGLTREKMLEMVDYRRVILAAHYRREGCREAGERLLAATLGKRRLGANQKRLLRIIYRYTALGGRGVYLLWH